jgi:type IX secretion system PorP/SprF family membrane protein
MIIFFCITQQFHSQEDGVVAFNLPVRSSLKFNRYAINPTFSFVREQNKYISFTNKRQWAQFDNAPQTYLFSYSGRLKENIGVGLGVFQQDYGVLTTFGAVLNFAYNATLNTDSNLTFGMNLGFYKSGINEGKVITNFPDSSLENISSNSLLTINPGINYGTEFIDFGVSINNLVSYNLKTSKIIEDNPEQSIQAHFMYTGYLNSRGFFDESKFSTLVRSEFKKEETVVSGIMMLTVPKGIWAQAGYNTLYGVSAGIGLNITTQIAVEYNYEKALGDLSTFGNSHEITVAYKFKNKERFNYSGDDDEQALLISKKKPRRVLASNKPSMSKEERALLKANAEEARRIRLEGIAKAKADKEAKVEAGKQARIKLAEETQAKAEEVVRLKLEEEATAKSNADEMEKLRLEAEVKAKSEEEARIKLAEEKLRIEENAKLKKEEARLKLEEEERLRLEAETQAKVIEQERLEAEKKIDTVQLDGVLVITPTDKLAIDINSLTKLTDKSKIEQQNLILKLEEKIASKKQDLDDLKEENDLSEQGIYGAPKAFKSVSAENAAIEGLKLSIENLIESQNLKITELERLYNERLKTVPNKSDEANKLYQRKIAELKSEQSEAIRSKENLVSTLEDIKVATDFERKRRIKRAAYDNEEDRYVKDRATLNQIKRFTPVSSVQLTEEDFDFGEEQSGNITIVKDIKNVESGYYLVLAVHNDVEKRDAFLTKAVSTGLTNINFFYDVNTSKYYIYYEKFNSIERANNAMKSKGSEPYNSKTSMVKIEN